MDDDERRALSEAQQVAEGKKKDLLKKIGKKIIRAAIASLPVILTLLKVLAVIIIIMAIYSIFAPEGGTGDEEEELITQYETTYPDITSEIFIWSEENIKNFINNYKTDNEDLRNQMLNKISEIKKWQDDYGYGAGVLITIAFEENIQDFDSFLDDMRQNAEKWKEEGYTKINEIAEDYVGDETAAEWANNIINKINETAIDSGIINVGEETAETGDGYEGTFTDKFGRTFYNFKQHKGSYANYIWVYGSNYNTIENNGCALTAASIILSGYLNTPKNPKQLVQDQAPDGKAFNYAPSPANYFLYYGITATRPYSHHYTELTTAQKQVIIDKLISGNQIVIYVLGYEGINYGGNHYTGNSSFTTSQHWMALLDYNEADDTIYVSNPSPNGGTGWKNRDIVLTSCTEYILIEN